MSNIFEDELKSDRNTSEPKIKVRVGRKHSTIIGTKRKINLVDLNKPINKDKDNISTNTSQKNASNQPISAIAKKKNKWKKRSVDKTTIDGKTNNPENEILEFPKITFDEKDFSNLGLDYKSEVENDKFISKYKSAMTLGNSNDIIAILKEKICYLEKDGKYYSLLIEHLRQDIHKKERVISLLSNTNNDLKNSLNNFSMRLNKEILSYKSEKISKKNTKNEKKNETNENLRKFFIEFENSKKKIKILKNDNEKYKKTIDEYKNFDKNKELENMNLFLQEQENSLNSEIKDLKKQLSEHEQCDKKINALLEEIKYLKEENKRYKNENKSLCLKFKQKLSLSSDYNKKNINKLNLLNSISTNNILWTPKMKNIQNEPLPKIKNKNFNSMILKESEENTFNNFFEKNQIEILSKLFGNNEKDFNEFKNKILILIKSKESLENKYKSEIKILNNKIETSDKDNEILKSRLKEIEKRMKIYQVKLHESNNIQIQLQRKINTKSKGIVNFFSSGNIIKRVKCKENIFQKENENNNHFKGE